MASSLPSSPTHKQILIGILVLASVHVLVSLACVILGFSKEETKEKKFYEEYGKWAWIVSLVVTILIVLAVLSDRVN